MIAVNSETSIENRPAILEGPCRCLKDQRRKPIAVEPWRAGSSTGDIEGIPILLKLQQIERDFLAVGNVDRRGLEAMRQHLYADGKTDRAEADLFVEQHERAQDITPALENFFYRAIKYHILADGRIDAEEAAWLRRMFSTNGVLKAEERKLLVELNSEAKEVGREFEILFAECMKLPPEPHASV
jgi:hypothetical protein